MRKQKRPYVVVIAATFAALALAVTAVVGGFVPQAKKASAGAPTSTTVATSPTMTGHSADCGGFQATFAGFPDDTNIFTVFVDGTGTVGQYLYFVGTSGTISATWSSFGVDPTAGGSHTYEFHTDSSGSWGPFVFDASGCVATTTTSSTTSTTSTSSTTSTTVAPSTTTTSTTVPPTTVTSTTSTTAPPSSTTTTVVSTTTSVRPGVTSTTAAPVAVVPTTTPKVATAAPAVVAQPTFTG